MQFWLNSKLQLVFVTSLFILCFSLDLSGANYSQIFFAAKVDSLEYQLPDIDVLEIPKAFNTDCLARKNKTNPLHQFEYRFLGWLCEGNLKSFNPELTEICRRKTSKSKRFFPHNIQFNGNSTFSNNKSGRKSNYYFLPAFPNICQAFSSIRLNYSWWYSLDGVVQSVSKKTPNLWLDRVFMSSPFPHAQPVAFNPRMRNMGDIRYFRLDPQKTVQGREVYIPYSVSSAWFAAGDPLQPRNRFMFGLLNERSFMNDDKIRKWRENLRNSLNSIKNNNSTKHIMQNNYFPKSLPNNQFMTEMKDSDFCLIVPGDTDSTSRLYKAIFSGCIPIVFLTYPSELPFSHFVNWKAFSIVLMKDMINRPNEIRALYKELSKLRENSKQLRNYKMNLFYAKRLFDFSILTWPSVYHLSLLEMAYLDNNAMYGSYGITSLMMSWNAYTNSLNFS
eukprot:gene4444-6286_t